jgi:hypothetical protein
VEELLNFQQALLAAMGVVSVSGDGYQPLVISYCLVYLTLLLVLMMHVTVLYITAGAS